MSSSSPLIHRFLYTSRLSPGLASDAVSQILRQSRERNRQRAISGALVFDGERFCQLLEGEPTATAQLAERIAADPRHHALRVLVDAADVAPRLFPQWHSGYGDPEALDEVDPPDGTLAAGAPPSTEWRLAAFARMVAGCDMSL